MFIKPYKFLIEKRDNHTLFYIRKLYGFINKSLLPLHFESEQNTYRDDLMKGCRHRNLFYFHGCRIKVQVGWLAYTEETILPIAFTLNGVWSWWQFSFRFWTKWKSNWFKIERKNCHHDHIPFNVKGNGSIVFSVWVACSIKTNKWNIPRTKQPNSKDFVCFAKVSQQIDMVYIRHWYAREITHF